VRCSSSSSTLVLCEVAARGRARACTLSTPCTKYSCGGTPLVPNNLQCATCCGEVVAVRRSCARACGGGVSAPLPWLRVESGGCTCLSKAVRCTAELHALPNQSGMLGLLLAAAHTLLCILCLPPPAETCGAGCGGGPAVQSTWQGLVLLPCSAPCWAGRLAGWPAGCLGLAPCQLSQHFVEW
jgi:hypothetical protein